MNQFLYTLLSLHFLNDGVRTAILVLLPFVVKDMHLNFTQVGFLGSSQGFLAGLLAIPAGLLGARIGGYRLILLSLLLYSLGALGIGLSPNIFILMVMFYLTAGGFGMFHVIGYTLVSRMSQKTNIGRNLGNFTATGDIGRVALPALAVFLIPFFSWRIIYIGIALSGLLVYGFLQISNRKGQITKTGQKEKETHYEWIKQATLLLRQKKLLLITAAAAIDGLAGTSIYIFLPFLLLYKGVTATILGVFTGIYFAGSLFGKSLLGRSADRFGNAKIFVIAELLMATCSILLAFSHQIFFLLIVAFLLGLFTRGTTPVVTTLFSEIVHADHYEKVFAVGEMFLGITASFAPIFMGIIADRLGITFVFYIAALLATLATLPILFLKKKA